MKNNILCLLILLLLASCGNENSQQEVENTNKRDFKEEIDHYLSELEDDDSFMGSLAISKNGKSIYSGSIGYRDLNKELKANTNTIYRIASITKSFTATLVFKAIEANKIKLNQSIDRFFPTLKNADKITIKHLLHHQSGIKSYTKSDYFWNNRTTAQSAEDLLKAIHEMEIEFKAGKNTKYSNSNYFLLARIVEQVFDNTYEKLLQEHIIVPLNLKSTSIGKKIQSSNNESLSYTLENDQWVEFPETNLSIAKGAGSLVSTPADLNVFFRSLLTGKLISSESLKSMKTIEKNHGMGIFRFDLLDQTGFGHGGNIDGFNARSIYFKDLDLAISLVSNASRININEVYSRILELYLGVPEVEISASMLKNYEGTYVYDQDSTDTSVFEIEGDKLILIIAGEYREELTYKGNRRFLFSQMSGPSISFTFSEDGSNLFFEQANVKRNYIKKRK
ncbi:serine hydrolase domain-containing protein [Marivirga arenosa]|uniref:Serine hydrolase domain-containing protein n=1 Tax=Marivirga arenosa TaxID=3059076 RepID=A0AA51X4P9_9BACT|nr:serine hydrolase domain-containing protein [Marivirga sp. BKB1-2]WNB16906.1 serine hydrolase domain-containing protein [Marivirga sp. BKB1-2]